MKINRVYVYIFAFLSMLFWGFSYIWVKQVYEYYNPLTVVFLRLLLASIILLIIYRFFRKRKTVEREDIKYFVLLAFFEPFLYFLGESFGLKLVSPTIAAVIIATIPVFTPIAAFLFLKERVSLVNILGLMISFVGVLFMILNRDFSFNASPTGILLMFGAVVAAMGFTIFVKKLADKYSVVTIITYQNIIGGIFILPLFLYFDYNSFISVKPTYDLVITILQLVVFSSILAFLLFILVIRELGATRANIFSNLIPVITAIFSYFILDELFKEDKIIGTALVIGGVLLTQITKLKRKKRS